MKNFKRITFLFAIICFTFFACEGPEGPEGPQGTQGIQGVEGPQGTEGNANVSVTIFTIYDSQWSKSGSIWYYNTSLSIITSDIANNGIVLVFVKSTNSDAWQALPYTWPGTYEKICRYWYAAQYLELQIYSEYAYYAPSTDYTYKVAAIGGNLITKAKKDGVNLNDYKQTKEYFKFE